MTSNLKSDYLGPALNQTAVRLKSSRADSIMDEEFTEFLSAYEDHVQSISKQKSTPHKKSDVSTRLYSNSSTCSKLSPDHFFSNSTKSKKSGRKTKRMDPSLLGSCEVKPTSNNFKLYPLPTHKVVSVMNCLRQIEDEIEDEE